MAQSDFEKKAGFDESRIDESEEKGCSLSAFESNVMTGGVKKDHQLYGRLIASMQKADRIDIIVSFLMESGVRMMIQEMKKALERQVPIRILTGNYLGITQPSALYLLKQAFGDAVDLRFYNDSSRSFHPKSYIFHGSDCEELYIGSSNLSRSALTDGIEWNYRLERCVDPLSFDQFCAQFETLFFHHSIVVDDALLKDYAQGWHQPMVYKDLHRFEQRYVEHEHEPEEEQESLPPVFQPRGAQIEALYALENSREQGASKGLVQAATGVGKTYLAAFDSVSFSRVLFVAHREEILHQAATAFQNVRPKDSVGFFMGAHKDTSSQMIFASAASLGKKEYLNPEYFDRNAFDYIVIDEFHHAVNEQYQRITDYFQPKFLLGLTATPERMDGRNIYELCDYNVPYEISLQQAINRGMLVPFHYYGIYDQTDYSGLRFVRGRYDAALLSALYENNRERLELIIRHYRKYPSKRALGFCVSRQHAFWMAREFSKHGIPAAAVCSGSLAEGGMERQEALEKLRKQEVRVLFSVDMFNEGLDVPDLDLVMFLRPTESPVVFLQQLGRGLRMAPGKEYLNVLDFIGNYKQAQKVPQLLGLTPSARRTAADTLMPGPSPVADGCLVDFDIRLIDLFERLERKSKGTKAQIRLEIERVSQLLDGRVPTRMELFTLMDDDVYQYCLRHAKENPFRNYLGFLQEAGMLSKEEQVLFDGVAREFLQMLETTNMSKVYKMPVLSALYNHGDIWMKVNEKQTLKAWKEFFDQNCNWRDLADNITLEEYRSISDKEHLRTIRKMPVHFLIKSGKGFFQEGSDCLIALHPDLEKYLSNEAFIRHFGDILAYRTMSYYRRRFEESKTKTDKKDMPADSLPA